MPDQVPTSNSTIYNTIGPSIVDSIPIFKNISTTIIESKILKKNLFSPEYIVDIGCAHGEWFLKANKIFSNSKFLLFDADKKNEYKLSKLSNISSNITYKFSLLSNQKKLMTFFLTPKP